MTIRVFLRDSPQRAVALASDTHVLIFRHSPSSINAKQGSSTSLNEAGIPRCIVEFTSWEEAQDMQGYRTLSSINVQGTLGLVTLNGDIFLCVVNGSTRAATVRPGENIQQILSVEFHCLNRSDYDHLLHDQINPYPTDGLDADGFDHGSHKDPVLDHPCLALRKLLSGGTFYYSADFDLTKRLQDRPTESSSVAIDSLDAGFLWNSYMIQPLVDFRSRLSYRERQALDDSRILTSAIRGFARTIPVPSSSSPARMRATGMPSNMTLISRLSCRRAGTRFNARGIDDDGNTANFVETETIFCTDTMCFSYAQCRGSVPLFWEQSSGLPGQQKIQITRSLEASQPAFDKHFERLFRNYGDVLVVNLLSEEKTNEVLLTRQYDYHIANSSLNQKIDTRGESETSEHKHISAVNYDFHAETRGPYGYEAAKGIKQYIHDSAIAFEYFLTEELQETVIKEGEKRTVTGQNDILKQAGIFRTNCLDCLDRTNLVQTIISQMAMEIFLFHQAEGRATSDFWARHGTLWADNGDALSKIYAGTGALKSSFTRSGKMSLAGALADVRKSAQRLYINNFEDKGRQNTIDMLLGRLIGQVPVHLYDPVNDWVQSELSKRSVEFTSSRKIIIWAGTFNLNGKTVRPDEDLRCWLCPDVEQECRVPDIVAVAFQEIVQLDVQQIMSTDPHRRQAWESTVKQTLNANARKNASEDYVLLRGGQLVGASLSVFVKASTLPYIKNVEGSVKKTGMSGMAGNKGAVAIRMDYANTSICFVTAHLAAGFSNYDERNQDYRTISHGLRFQRSRTIEDHTTVIWFGDFNYRIGMENERTRQLIKKGEFGILYENDQLNLQMVHGKCFPHYSEQVPNFAPTYKFDIGTDEYDTSEKSRIPAWCDRILTRGDNLRQLHYNSAPLKFSDHRPVWGLFRCAMSVIDSAKRDQISNELYTKRRMTVGNHTASQIADSDDESLYGYDSIEPGLPPASSDKRKWWLDNGMPARSTIQPPSAQHSLNPARPSNPFPQSSETDWVRVEKPIAPTSQAASVRSTTGESRKPLPPPRNDPAAPPKPPRPSPYDGIADSDSTLKRTPSKPAPPKPSKPDLLRSDTNQSSSAPSSPSLRSVPPTPPESRRSQPVSRNPGPGNSSPLPVRTSLDSTRPARGGTSPLPLPPISRRPVGSQGAGKLRNEESGEVEPPLPPRRAMENLSGNNANRGLMDDEGDGEGERERLRDWTPLEPQN